MKKNHKLARPATAMVAACLMFGQMPAALAAEVTPNTAVIAGHYAKDALLEFVQAGYLSGDETGDLRPDATITRAELAALVNRVFGFTDMSDEIGNYTDVPADAWYHKDMAKALAAGYMSGTSKTTMSPSEIATREQAFSMLSRLLKLTEGSTADLAEYPDAQNISAYARAHMAAMVTAGYVRGDADKNLLPKKPLTRAEAVLVLSRVKNQKALPEKEADTEIPAAPAPEEQKPEVQPNKTTNSGGGRSSGGGGNSGKTRTTFTGYEAIGAQRDVAYIDTNPASYALPQEVVYTLSDGTKVTLQVESWTFQTTPAAGTTVTAEAKVTLPAEHKDKQESFDKIKVTAELRFREAVQFTDYEKIAPLQDVVFADTNPASYALPQEVVYTLSDGAKVTLPVESWTFQTTPAAGTTVIAEAKVTLPAEHKDKQESFDKIKVTAELRFREAVQFTDYEKITPLQDVVFADTNPASYALPHEVVYTLSDGAKVTLQVESWTFQTTPAAGATVIAEAKVTLPAEYKDKQESFDKIKVTAELRFREEEVKLTGYQPFADVKTKFKDKFPSSYDLPKEVTYTLSDGNTLKLKIEYWVFDNVTQPAPGKTATAKAIVEDLPIAYNGMLEEFEKITVTVQVIFEEEQPTQEIKLIWDPAHVTQTSWGTERIEYKFDENPVLTVENYTGDGSDILLKTGYPSYLNLTNGAGLTYDSTKNTLTLSSEEVMKQGFMASLSGTLTIGGKNFSVYINYTTDRSVQFEDAHNPGSVTYSNVSRKKDLVKTVTFTNVPKADIDAVTFHCNGEDVTDKVTLTAGAAENTRVLTVPYAAMKDYIKSTWSGDGVSLEMRTKGLAAATINITYMAAPKLTLDRSNGYYAVQNPVVTLMNFSFAQTTAEELKISVKYADGSEKVLKSGEDFTLKDGKLELNSENILGTDTLSEEKTLTLTVQAEKDEETASVEVLYKKDKQIVVESVEGLAPYMAVSAPITGLERGEGGGVAVYCGEDKLNGVTVKSSGGWGEETYFISIPYESVAAYLVNDKVTLTAKLDGSPDGTFTVEYAQITDAGEKLPIDLTKIGDNYGDEVTAKQDGLPKASYTGTISLIPADKSLTKEDWLNMGVTIKKKGADDSKAIAIGVSGTATDWSDGSVKAVVLDSLYSYKDKFDAQDNFDSYEDGSWPVYTITLYKVGYAKTEIDVVLFKYKW